jgi:hypothetical protein
MSSKEGVYPANKSWSNREDLANSPQPISDHHAKGTASKSTAAEIQRLHFGKNNQGTKEPAIKIVDEKG